jgi:hypothetical protein
MSSEQMLLDDEPVLPDSYLRRGPATSGELWALDQWRYYRRVRQKPANRFLYQMAPFVMLVLLAVVSWAFRERSLSGFGAAALGVGLLIRYQTHGYIRLLERYSEELGRLREQGRSRSA